jgi:enoyl-CoA hydratase
MIDRSLSGSVATLRFNYGKAAALDVELVDAIALAFAELGADDAVHAVILTGSGSIFSAGVDLFRLTEGGHDYASRFLPSLGRMLLDLFKFPKPLVVAVNGHAIAGGCLFALAGGYRLMAQGNGRIGLPEMLVGVPFPPSVIEAVRFALPAQQLQSMLYTGKTVLPDEALQRGLVDELVEPSALESRAQEMAQHFASLPRRAFELAKHQMRETAVDRARHYANELDREVIELWSAPETLDRVRAYLAKTVKKG